MPTQSRGHGTQRRSRFSLAAAEAAVGWDKAGSAAAGPPFKVSNRVAVVGRRSLRELVPPYVSKRTRFHDRKSFTALLAMLAGHACTGRLWPDRFEFSP